MSSNSILGFKTFYLTRNFCGNRLLVLVLLEQKEYFSDSKVEKSYRYEVITLRAHFRAFNRSKSLITFLKSIFFQSVWFHEHYWKTVRLGLFHCGLKLIFSLSSVQRIKFPPCNLSEKFDLEGRSFLKAVHSSSCIFFKVVKIQFVIKHYWDHYCQTQQDYSNFLQFLFWKGELFHWVSIIESFVDFILSLSTAWKNHTKWQGIESWEKKFLRVVSPEE